MNEKRKFDLIIIGAGPGGYVAAIRAAQLKMNVALIEKEERLGGTCLNIGCIPSKALLESSELFEKAEKRFEEHGITTEPPVINVGRMLSRKDRIVRELTDGIAVLMKKNRITVIRGTAVLKGDGAVEVTGSAEKEQLESEHIILAMGSVPVELPFMPFDGKQIVTSTGALSFDKVPKRLIVVGAGAVGLELGSVWSRLGSEVTVLELLPVITPFADKMASKTLEKALKARGLDIRLKSTVRGAEVKKRTVKVTFLNPSGEEETLSAEKVLVAVGRKPATSGTGLKEIGIEIEEGMIKIDDQFRTSIPGIYAIGDLVRGPMLAHKASDEGAALAERIAGKAGVINYDVIPNVVYTEPELAQVGLTEEELKESGTPYVAGRFFFAGNGRAKSMGEEDGLVKILAHKETDRILGAHIVGPRASEMIHELVIAMEFGGSAEDIALAVHAHPTLSEAIREAAMAAGKRAIHR